MDSVSACSGTVLNGTSHPASCKNELWDEKVQVSSEVLDHMRNGSLAYQCPMRKFLEERGKVARFNNEVIYGIIEYKGKQIAVVLKPKEDDKSAAYAEEVAYRIYEKAIAPITGNHFVPPTVTRTMPDGRIASCQYFVETEDSEDMWNEPFRGDIFKNAPHDEVQELSVFNTVFNNWDRHPGNFLANQRDGRIHFASIDNESIENRGILETWGERSYIASLWTPDERADIPKTKITLPRSITLEGFKSVLKGYGFNTEHPRIKNIYNNFFKRGGSAGECYIHHGSLLIPYHRGNSSAFPLPRAPYSATLVQAYTQLTQVVLDDCYRPLVDMDPERFRHRVRDVLERRDTFLAACV